MMLSLIKLRFFLHLKLTNQFSRNKLTDQLKKMNNSQWAAPTFIIPKMNDAVRINLDFQNYFVFVGWKETKVPMKSINCKMRIEFLIKKSTNIKSGTNRIKKILDAKY